MSLLTIIQTFIFPLALLLVFMYGLIKAIRIIEWQMEQILYIIQTNRERGLC
jgi:hypothetical protein